MTITVSKKFKVDFTEWKDNNYVTKEVILNETDVNDLIEKLKNVKKEKGAK